MKFRLTVLIVFSLCLSNVFADEGMWLLGNLRKNKQTDRVMKELGLQMPVNKIYDPKKPCLADAVVSFGGFCSGVVVSEDGLVFTNHHCGFSSIQQHSSVEHDYLKDGFFARSLEEELPNPELYVRWMQFGAFSPILRSHSTKIAGLTKEPWVFSNEVSDILRGIIRQRYNMVPYIYTMAREAYETGLSLCRPMYYDYPETQEDRKSGV